MSKLRQLAMSAKDPSQLAGFYRQVFDLTTVQESENTVHLSDGSFNLAILKTQEDRPWGLHHLGFHVESMQTVGERLEKIGARTSLFPSPDGQPYAEFRVKDPDGNLVDLSEGGFGVCKKKGQFPIRHIALYTPNPQRLADFYSNVFAMRQVSRTDRASLFVSDGYFNLALLFQRSEEKLGLHHFGFHVKSNEEMRERVERAGGSSGARRPERIPYAEYRIHDPEGHGIDISEKGWEA